MDSKIEMYTNRWAQAKADKEVAQRELKEALEGLAVKEKQAADARARAEGAEKLLGASMEEAAGLRAQVSEFEAVKSRLEEAQKDESERQGAVSGLESSLRLAQEELVSVKAMQVPKNSCGFFGIALFLLMLAQMPLLSHSAAGCAGPRASLIRPSSQRRLRRRPKPRMRSRRETARGPMPRGRRANSRES